MRGRGAGKHDATAAVAPSWDLARSVLSRTNVGTLLRTVLGSGGEGGEGVLAKQCRRLFASRSTDVDWL